jgi:hypothetical protein
MFSFSLPVLVRALLVWLLIIAVESAQGALRYLLFGPEVQFLVRQVSVLTGAAIIFALAWVCRRWTRTRTASGTLATGVLWVGLTLAFEIVLGRATGLSWDRIASDYDLRHGGLMPIGLIALALTPWIVRGLETRRLLRLNQRLV